VSAARFAASAALRRELGGGGALDVPRALGAFRGGVVGVSMLRDDVPRPASRGTGGALGARSGDT
jgi:hypothetical protein